MKKVAWCGLLVALALSLSVAESWFPLALIVPVPGIKLGLANVVIAVALYTMSVRETAAIMVGKVVLTAVFSASVTGFLFSLLGGVCSVFTMSLLKSSPKFSVLGVSAAGAAAHNAGQIAAAAFVLKSGAVVSYLPVLLFASIPVGLVTGSAAHLVLEKIAKKFE